VSRKKNQQEADRVQGMYGAVQELDRGAWDPQRAAQLVGAFQRFLERRARIRDETEMPGSRDGYGPFPLTRLDRFLPGATLVYCFRDFEVILNGHPSTRQGDPLPPTPPRGGDDHGGSESAVLG
jgi:hypothetical protein